jgi:hypothetical protein
MLKQPDNQKLARKVKLPKPRIIYPVHLLHTEKWQRCSLIVDLDLSTVRLTFLGCAATEPLRPAASARIV